MSLSPKHEHLSLMAQPAPEICRCSHSQLEHKRKTIYINRRIEAVKEWCLVAGCMCRHFEKWEEMSSQAEDDIARCLREMIESGFIGAFVRGEIKPNVDSVADSGNSVGDSVRLAGGECAEASHSAMDAQPCNVNPGPQLPTYPIRSRFGRWRIGNALLGQFLELRRWWSA